MNSVLIVDDHRLVRVGLSRLLADASDIDILGEVDSGEAALDFIREHRPDVVLMDLRMPGIGGLEATRRALQIDPYVHIIVVSMFEEEPFPTQLFRAGASGYVTKGADAREMLTAIRTVLEGDRYVSAKVAQHMALGQMREHGGNPFEVLSSREMQVALMVANSTRVQEIAGALHLSPKTVNSYRYRIFDKLGVGSDVALTRLAIRNGVVDPEISPRRARV